MKIFAWVLLACFFLTGVSPIFANGAIDLVALKKQEEERRKKIAKSKQAINDTNVSTVSGSAGKSYGFVQMESEAPPAEAAAAVTPAAGTGAEGEMAENKQPDFWKKQQIELETRIAELREDIAGEQNRIEQALVRFLYQEHPGRARSHQGADRAA